MVLSGAAPALIVYEWALRAWAAGLDRGLVTEAGAVLRLARFNTNIGVVDKRFFQGLPRSGRGRWWWAWCGW